MRPERSAQLHLEGADRAIRDVGDLLDMYGVRDESGRNQLLDMATQVSRSVYGGGTLGQMAGAAYAAARVPHRFRLD